MTPTKIRVLLSFMFEDQARHAAAAEPEILAEQQAQDAQYYRRALHELIDLGTDLARMVHKHGKLQAEAAQSAADFVSDESMPDQSTKIQFFAPPPAAMQDPTLAFDRIARAIRRTIILARKITEPLPPPATNAPQQRTAARKRIIREVEDVIQRRDTEENEAERLHAEFLERLDDPDLDDEIADRPVADIIKDICRDLGIAHLPAPTRWKRRTPTEIATLAAWAAMPPPIESRASGKTDVVVPLWPYQRHSGETIPDPPPPH